MAGRSGAPAELADLFSIMAVNECVQECVEDLEEYQDLGQMSEEQTLLLKVLQQRLDACAFGQTSRFLPARQPQPGPPTDTQPHAAQENRPPGPSCGASGLSSEPDADAGGDRSECAGSSPDSRWYTLGLTREDWVGLIRQVPGVSHLPQGRRERKQHEDAFNSHLHAMVWAHVRLKLEQHVLQLEDIADRYLSHGSFASEGEEMALDLPSKVRQLKKFARQKQQQLQTVRLATLQAAKTVLQELRGASEAFQGLLHYRLSDQPRMDQAEAERLGSGIDGICSRMSVLEMTVVAETYDKPVVAALENIRSLIDVRKEEQLRLLLEKRERLRRLQGNSRFMDIAVEIKRQQEILDKLKARRVSEASAVQGTPLETPLYDYGNRTSYRDTIPDTPNTGTLPSYKLRY